jgi:non-specific serine/threonine protein kinase
MQHTDQVIDNLPLPLNRFIGRTAEISALKQRVWSTRLLTLTGPGGCGKTRLALKVAEELRDAFADGVWLVELAPLSDPALIPQMISTAFGVQDRTVRPPLSSLIEFLRPRELLLVLDNCEHLIEACAHLAQDMLRACPNVRILATSREALNVAGESAWLVPSLSIDNPQQIRTKSDLLHHEAAQLFLDRAAMAQAAFEVTDASAPAIAQICYRLDGMPLAIELAAARVRALAVEQIADRLDDRFNLLNAGSRAAPARHQTLRAMIDWSYGLLDPQEKTLFRRLAIFSGGWTLEAAEGVCAGEDLNVSEVLPVLSHLVDKSISRMDKAHGETRYTLLETLRQYAHEKLVEAGEVDRMRDRHLAYFVHWAEAAEPPLYTAAQLEWLERYEAEHDNIRSALDWSQGHAYLAERHLRLAAACGRFWRLHGYISEGRARLTTALSQPGAQPRNITRARALNHSANLAYLQSDYPAMRSITEEALSIWRELGKEGRDGAAFALDLLGELATEEGAYDRAPAFFEEALEIYRELNSTRGISEVYMQLGWMAIRVGRYPLAAEHLEEFLTLARQLGDPFLLAFGYSGLGEVAVRQEQYARAMSWLQQSLALHRERGDKWGAGTTLGSLGWVALRRRDFKQMRELLGESLSLRQGIGDNGGMAWCLEKLAEAASLQGQPEKAAMIFGAAAALRAPIGSVIDPADRPDYERLIAQLRSTLGDSAFEASWARGQALPLDNAIDEALAEPDEPIAPSQRADKEKHHGLTAREREVAVLIAQGKSNREIAESLVLSERTIEGHVSNILNKLGFTARTQIAAWAVEKGLAKAEGA